MNKILKTIGAGLAGLALIAAAAFLTFGTKAQLQPEGFYGGQLGAQLRQGTTWTTNTGTPATGGFTNGGNWTNAVVGATVYTNVIRIPCSGKDVSLQFSAATFNGTSNMTVIWWIGRSVDGSMPTNIYGAGNNLFNANIDQNIKVAQTINGTTNSTYITNLNTTFSAPYLYVLALDNSTNSATVTNASVTVLSRP